MNWPHFLNWMKNTLLFTISTNILVCLLTVNMKNFFTPKIWKCATPLLNTRAHSSQSNCENASPSSTTSPLASYEEVAPPLPLRLVGSYSQRICNKDKLWKGIFGIQD